MASLPLLELASELVGVGVGVVVEVVVEGIMSWGLESVRRGWGWDCDCDGGDGGDFALTLLEEEESRVSRRLVWMRLHRRRASIVGSSCLSVCVLGLWGMR